MSTGAWNPPKASFREAENSFAFGSSSLFKISSFALIGIPAAVLPIVLGSRRLGKISRASQDRVADANSLASEKPKHVRLEPIAQTIEAKTRREPKEKEEKTLAERI